MIINMQKNAIIMCALKHKLLQRFDSFGVLQPHLPTHVHICIDSLQQQQQQKIILFCKKLIVN